jgi:acetyltransferase-like isoleucine patch superfamily enzyme
MTSVFVFFFAIILVTGWQGRMIHRIFPLAAGTFSLEHPGKIANVWKLLGFLNLFNLSLLIHTYLCPVTLRWSVYRFLGAQIGNNVMVGGKIIEPWMVSIGNTVVLGEDCLVLGHTISRSNVTLGRVAIGNNVTIGVKAVIMPDVNIGDGAVVWAGAVVPRGTRIGPNEEWAGIPAHKVQKQGARKPDVESA